MVKITDIDIEKMKTEILEVVEKQEKKYGVRIHISEWKYDDLKDKTNFDITLYSRNMKDNSEEENGNN